MERTAAHAITLKEVRLWQQNEYCTSGHGSQTRDVRTVKLRAYSGNTWVDVMTSGDLPLTCGPSASTGDQQYGTVTLPSNAPTDASIWMIKVNSVWGPTDGYAGFMEIEFDGCPS